MALAPIKCKCSVDECQFSAPSNCLDWEKMLKILEFHTAAAHGVVANKQSLNTSPRETCQFFNSVVEWIAKPKKKSIAKYVSKSKSCRKNENARRKSKLIFSLILRTSHATPGVVYHYRSLIGKNSPESRNLPISSFSRRWLIEDCENSKYW